MPIDDEAEKAGWVTFATNRFLRAIPSMTSSGNGAEESDLIVLTIRNRASSTLLDSLADGAQVRTDEIDAIVLSLLRANARFRREVARCAGKPLAARRGDHLAFVSYRRGEAFDFVERLASSVDRTRDVRLMYDKSFLHAGDFPVQLGNGIRRADVLVLIIMETTLDRIGDPDDWVRRELETASRYTKPIIPVLVDVDGRKMMIEWPRTLAHVPLENALEYKRSYASSSTDRLCEWIRHRSRQTRQASRPS